MKTLKVKDSNGQPVRGWSFWCGKVVNVGVDNRRVITGWFIQSPDGYQRMSEGNWERFVFFARQVVENHGFTTSIS